MALLACHEMTAAQCSSSGVSDEDANSARALAHAARPCTLNVEAAADHGEESAEAEAVAAEGSAVEDWARRRLG